MEDIHGLSDPESVWHKEENRTETEIDLKRASLNKLRELMYERPRNPNMRCSAEAARDVF